MMLSSCTCLTRCAISTEDVRCSGYLDRPPILTLHLHSYCDPLPLSSISLDGPFQHPLGYHIIPAGCCTSRVPSQPPTRGWRPFLVPYTPYVCSPPRRIITSTAMESFHTLEQLCPCRESCQSGHRILLPSPSLPAIHFTGLLARSQGGILVRIGHNF